MKKKSVKKPMGKKEMKKVKGGEWLSSSAGQRGVHTNLGLEKRGKHNPEPPLGPLGDV